MRYLETTAAVLALALAQGALARFGTAQVPVDPDHCNRLPVRVIGAADGLPRPGVVIHTAALREESQTFTPDGYVLAEDAQVRRLRNASVVRTDPEGRAWLDRSIANNLHRVFLGGAHYASALPKVEDGEVVIRAVDMEPVGVRVFDSDGTPLRGFGVALQGGGENLSIALTDDTGRAVLAAPRGFTARLTVLPASWVGPKDGFPTIAQSLAGRRGAALRLPAHGSLRLRAVRGGEPRTVGISAVTLTDPETYEVLHSRGLPSGNTVDAFGIEFPFAALGFDFSASTHFDGSLRQLTGKGPRVAGERAVCDVDLGHRPAFALRLCGAGEAMQLRCTAVTDRGRVQAFGRVDAAGAVDLDFRDGILGKRLLRLEVDSEVRATRGGHGAAWHVVLQGDHDLSQGTVDLGEVVWQARAPQMRGRVVDEKGAPIGKASVVILRNGEANNGVVVETDVEGRFEFIGPLYRDNDGVYLRAVATASLDGRSSEPSLRLDAGAEVELTIRRDVPAPPPPRGTPPAPGSLIARIANVPADIVYVQLLGAGNLSHDATVIRRAGDGYREYVFENLRPGHYVLCATSPALGRFPVLGALDVAAGAQCQDERLKGLGLMDNVVVANVRVVDRVGVPMASVRLTGDTFLCQTDGTGMARIPMLRGVATGGLVEAPGMRSQRFAELSDGQTVVLTPPGTLTVTVHGIPDDVARGNVEVWVRDEVRERFAGPRAAVGNGNMLRVPMPAQGRYLINVLVRTSVEGHGRTWTGVFRSEEVLVVGDDPDQQAEVRLDDASVKRLREALARLR